MKRARSLATIACVWLAAKSASAAAIMRSMSRLPAAHGLRQPGELRRAPLRLDTKLERYRLPLLLDLPFLLRRRRQPLLQLPVRPGQPFLGHPEDPVVLPQRRDEVLGHALPLHPEQVDDVEVGKHLVEVVVDAHDRAPLADQVAEELEQGQETGHPGQHVRGVGRQRPELGYHRVATREIEPAQAVDRRIRLQLPAHGLPTRDARRIRLESLRMMMTSTGVLRKIST